MPAPRAGAAQLYGTTGTTGSGGRGAASLGDILERVLDKGLVIAGDIQINLLDIELLTIKLRLVIASLDTAREVGINWWESDPWLSADAGHRAVERGSKDRRRTPDESGGLHAENRQLRRRIRELESEARDD
jgi:hypothetical protein